MQKRDILDKVYRSNLPSRAKQIMFYFINRANAEGTCFPSLRTIACDCGVSERTIQRTMKVLLEERFVIKENRYRDNGGQSSNLYKLQIDPENNGDKRDIDDENKINEEKIELEKEKNNSLEGIETVTFDAYVASNEIQKNKSNREKQTVLNILVQKIAQGDNLTIKTKCHPIFFKQKTENLNIGGRVTPLKLLCHGVSDNLCPPWTIYYKVNRDIER